MVVSGEVRIRYGGGKFEVVVEVDDGGDVEFVVDIGEFGDGKCGWGRESWGMCRWWKFVFE